MTCQNPQNAASETSFTYMYEIWSTSVQLRSVINFETGADVTPLHMVKSAPNTFNKAPGLNTLSSQIST